MAQASDVFRVEVSLVERQWIHKALSLQRQSLIRSRGNELSGSEVWHLRGREIEALTGLMVKFQ